MPVLYQLIMESFLPLFPLKLVAFPGEILNLHIFEERYKQLIHECLAQNIPFGIVSYIEDRVEYGTEVDVLSVVNEYDDGSMDITTQASRVFKVTTFVNPTTGKLYAGGDVFFLDNIDNNSLSTRMEMIELIKKLFSVVSMVESVEVAEDITAFDVGHKVGLSLEQKYALIQIEQEEERQQYVINHLRQTIPVLQEMEQTKERIRMNGHFKKFDPLDF